MVSVLYKKLHKRFFFCEINIFPFIKYMGNNEKFLAPVTRKFLVQ